MKVEIFSDVVCPWCAIGKRRFERAVAQFSHSDEVEVVWRAFQLNPSPPTEKIEDLTAYAAKKFGISKEEMLAAQARLAAVGAEEGLDLRFDRARQVNTFDAHRLLHYAGEVGGQNELKERLFHAYFTDGAPIDDHETLVGLATEVGLDATTAAEVLQTGKFGAEVQAELADARALGISGVPFFVIDRQYGISGAQSPEAILGVLEEAWNRSHPAITVVGSDAACVDESCLVPQPESSGTTAE